MQHASVPLAAVWRCGPDAGTTFELTAGRHLVGRATSATVRCDDPDLQAHHAVLDVSAAGAVTVMQLTGRSAIRVDGRAIEGAAAIALAVGSVVEVGNSTLVVTSRTVHDSAQIRDGAVVRIARTISEYHTPELAAPAPLAARDEPTGGLMPALFGLTGSGAIAILLRQPMFLLFGALGATVAVASWSAQRLNARRRWRLAVTAHEAATAGYERRVAQAEAAHDDHVRASVPLVEQAARTLGERGSSLWSRRQHHPDASFIAIGLSPTVDDLPIVADVGAGCRLALLGPYADAVARSITLQLAAACGPADVRITVVSDRPDRWQCLNGLPNATLPDGTAAIVGEDEVMRVLSELSGHGPPAALHLLLTDQPALLATRTSPLRRALGDPTRDALVVVVPNAGESASVPHICHSALTTTNGPLARWVPDVRRTMLPQSVRLLGVGMRTTARLVAAVRGLTDPEDSLGASSAIPRQLSLISLLEHNGALTASAIASRWAAGGHDPTPRSVVGVAADGIVDIDLARDGPHGLIAGTTGAGKSELLRSLIAGMAASTPPSHLALVLIDYKGGATFDACAELPHVVGVVTDLDDQLADRALRSLHAELRRRESILRQHGAADITELRRRAPSETLARLVVVIDEFAALVAEQPTFLDALVGVAQRGRSLGVHLLLATQRPSGVVSDAIRANTNLRLALRLQDSADAVDVVGIAAPAHFPRHVPGRALLRLGTDDHITFQTAQCTAPSHGESDLVVLVRAIRDAARVAGIEPPPSPWLPPLPSILDRDDLRGTETPVLGLVDDPDGQRTTPLRWSLCDGRLAIIGSAGSGVTSTLLTVVDQAMAAREDADVYVIDARGDARWAAVATHPRCGAVVELHERERLTRLLHRVRKPDSGTTLLVVDGLDALRRALDDPHTASEFDALEQVLTDAGSTLVIVAGAESAAALPMGFLNRCPARWVLHLHDAHDAALLGVAARAVPPAVPGRLVIAGADVAAQVVAPRAPLPVAPTRSTTTPPISVVPERVSAASLPSSIAVDGVTTLYMGIDFASGDPGVLEVPDGDHVVLVGTSRSGRSTGLSRVAAAWLQAHPSGWVGAIVPRRSTFSGHLADRTAADRAAISALLDELAAHLARVPALLIVDDADAVDDPSGQLAALAASGPGLLIAAAGRPDALRQSYGHWTGVVRRSRLGLIAASGTEFDGDLLNVQIPRRMPVSARPGLWWVADGGDVRLLQAAIDVPLPTAGAGSASRLAAP